MTEGEMTEGEAVFSHEGLVRRIVARYRRRWGRYRRIEAKDLKQSGRIGVMLALRTFDPSRGIKLSTWVGKRIEWKISEDWGGRRDDPLDHAYPIVEAIDPTDYFELIIARDEREWDRLRVRSALAGLAPREALIVRSRYAIECEPATLDALSKTVGVTRERVRQICLRGESRLFNAPEFGPEREAWKADRAAKERREYEEMLRRRAASGRAGMRLAGARR